MVGEGREVLHVPRDQRQALAQTARRDPRVVLRNRGASPLRLRGQPAPDVRDLLRGIDHGPAAEPGVSDTAPTSAPGPHLGPLPQLADRHERHDRNGAQEPYCQRRRDLDLQGEGSNIRVVDDVLHRRLPARRLTLAV